MYASIWSPRSQSNFCTANADGTIRIFDVNCPTKSSSQTINAHSNEVLTVDWSKYCDSVVFSGSTDGSVKMWDLRYPNDPVSILLGHQLAVRRIKCSPFNPNIIVSVGYDMTMRLWNVERPECPLEVYDAHSEFVFGVDWNLFNMNELATCSWDEHVHLIKPKSLMV